MCVCIKCIKSAKKHIQKCEIEIIDKGKYFWVNRRDLEKILLEIKSDYKNWAQVFDKYDPKKPTKIET